MEIKALKFLQTDYAKENERKEGKREGEKKKKERKKEKEPLRIRLQFH